MKIIDKKAEQFLEKYLNNAAQRAMKAQDKSCGWTTLNLMSIHLLLMFMVPL